MSKKLPEDDLKVVRQLPDEMMQILRQRINVKENDSSQDDRIYQMSPKHIVRHMAGWELGNPSWADVIAGWMKAAGADPMDFSDC